MEIGKLLTSLIFIIVPIVALIIFITIAWKTVPKDCMTNLGGNSFSILGYLKTCVDNCWSKHDYGKGIYSDDCYIVSVNSSTSLGKNKMEDFLKTPATTKVYFDQLGSNTKYKLKLRYNSSAPEISIIIVCDFIPQSFKSLVICEGKSVVSLYNNLLVIGDTSPYIGDCNNPLECTAYPQEITAPFEKLLLNAAKFFKGTNSNIIIIWEDQFADPSSSLRSRLMASLSSEGFLVDNLKHGSPLDLSQIENYDQVWLIRPGICGNPNFVDLNGDRICNYNWTISEFGALNSYLNGGGKIVLLSDVNVIPLTVNNEILSLVDRNSTFIQSGFCNNVNANRILAGNITEGISDYPIFLSTGVEVKCVA
jgi:hypothetical protein